MEAISITISSFTGWSVYLPADGLLLSQWHVAIVGLLLPNYRHFLDIRGTEIYRLCSADDGHPAEQILVFLLGFLCSCSNGGKFLLYAI